MERCAWYVLIVRPPCAVITTARDEVQVLGRDSGVNCIALAMMWLMFIRADMKERGEKMEIKKNIS